MSTCWPHRSRTSASSCTQGERLPVVLSVAEVALVLEKLDGMPKLMASLLYGSVLRVMECARLRVKDVNVDRGELLVRDDKGGKDRMTPLPRRLVPELLSHLVGVRRQHERDMRSGAGWMEVPSGLERKYPNAGREWAWQIYTHVLNRG